VPPGSQISDTTKAFLAQWNQLATRRMRRCHGGHDGHAEAGAHELENAGELVGLKHTVKFRSASVAGSEDLVS